jgi:hypothetical protein
VHALLSALQPVPVVSGEQVPSLVETLQATQSFVEPPPQAASQQNPSTQMFVEHSWQPATLQCPPLVPDAVLQAEPFFFEATHVPVLSQ